MRRNRLALAVGVTIMLLGTLESPALGQEANCTPPPGIRLYYGPGMTTEASYISSQIRVSENAYVFVVETDVNGLIKVLYPSSPGSPSMVAAVKPLALPSFFSGFDPATGGPRVGPGARETSQGTILALASCAPFSLDRIATGGEWNTEAIQSLIRQRPHRAIEVLAKYLGAKGEQIGNDRVSFSSSGNGTYVHISQPFLER